MWKKKDPPFSERVIGMMLMELEWLAEQEGVEFDPTLVTWEALVPAFFEYTEAHKSKSGIEWKQGQIKTS